MREKSGEKRVGSIRMVSMGAMGGFVARSDGRQQVRLVYGQSLCEYSVDVNNSRLISFRYESSRFTRSKWYVLQVAYSTGQHRTIGNAATPPYHNKNQNFTN